MNKTAILSRYKENNTYWLNKLKEYNYNIVVYNKFDGENLLPNIGRESHTYIYYILQNYHNLPDEMLFSQYNPLDHFESGVKGIIRGKNYENRFLKSKILDFSGIRGCQYDIIVRRRKIDWIKYNEILFGNYAHDQDFIRKLISRAATLNGVFRVSKNAILKHSYQFYENCLDMLSGSADPYEGYYFERIWRFLFAEYGDLDGIHYSMNNRIFLFGKANSGGTPRRLGNYGHIKLSEDGTICSNDNISYYSNFNECFWAIKNNILYFMDQDSAITSEYNLLYVGRDGIFYGDRYDEDGTKLNGDLCLRNPLFADYR